MDPVVSKRFNAGKPELDYVLMFPKTMEALARVCEAGGRKYGRGNFKLGGRPNEEYYASALRHLMQAVNVSSHDDETGGLHLAHAVWNLMAVIELNWDGPLYLKELDKTRK